MNSFLYSMKDWEKELVPCNEDEDDARYCSICGKNVKDKRIHDVIIKGIGYFTGTFYESSNNFTKTWRVDRLVWPCVEHGWWGQRIRGHWHCFLKNRQEFVDKNNKQYWQEVEQNYKDLLEEFKEG